MASDAVSGGRMSWENYSICMQNQFGRNWRQEIPSADSLEVDENQTVDRALMEDLYRNGTEERRKKETPLWFTSKEAWEYLDKELGSDWTEKINRDKFSRVCENDRDLNDSAFKVALFGVKAELFAREERLIRTNPIVPEKLLRAVISCAELSERDAE